MISAVSSGLLGAVASLMTGSLDATDAAAWADVVDSVAVAVDASGLDFDTFVDPSGNGDSSYPMR